MAWTAAAMCIVQGEALAPIGIPTLHKMSAHSPFVFSPTRFSYIHFKTLFYSDRQSLCMPVSRLVLQEPMSRGGDGERMSRGGDGAQTIIG